MSVINPLVTIIIPCYNSSEFVIDALKSVLNQDYENVEIIIVDDGSTDNLHEVVAPYLLCADVKLVVKTNGGLASARNYGIDKAKGEYLLPLDADDKIHPNYVSLAIKEFLGNKNLKLVYSKAKYFGIKVDEWILEDYSFEKLLLDNMIFCSALYKKSDFLIAGGYREELINGREDWDLWIRLLDEKSEVMKMPKVLFYYRKHKGNSMSDQFVNEEMNNKMLMEVYYLNKTVYMKYFGNPILFIQKYKFLEKKYELIKVKNLKLNNNLFRRVLRKINSCFSKFKNE